MSKRFGKEFESSFSSPAKKPKLDITIATSQQAVENNKQPSKNDNNDTYDDLWGDDFADEEMDIMFTQVCSQIANDPVDAKTSKPFPQRPTSTGDANSKPSTSYSNANNSNSLPKSTAQQSTSYSNWNNSSTLSKTNSKTLINSSDSNNHTSQYQSNSKPSTSYSNSDNHNSKSKISTFQPKAPSKLFSNPTTTQNSVSNGMQKAFPSIKNRKPIEISGMTQDQFPGSQLASSSGKTVLLFENEGTVLFEDFKDNLLNASLHNSTFRPAGGTILVSDPIPLELSVLRFTPNCGLDHNKRDDSLHRELDKLKLENKKLMDEIRTKEGETLFVRNQLQQAKLRADNEKMDKSRYIEEQASRYKTELNNANKETEKFKTQLKFQSLQLSNLQERCKLLESGSLKLTEPHTVAADSPGRNRFNTTLNKSSAVRTVKLTETSVQTDNIDIRSCRLYKAPSEHYPLKDIPKSIFEYSLPETSVVDIQIIEKIGKSNLPILQDEETFRIFENPDLVKPTVTMVDDRKLNVEFVLPDLALLMKCSAEEINCYHTIPVINKLVSTARELLLNSTVVLQTIRRAMRNDDIRDMNDVYFSDFTKMPVDYTKGICDSKPWYEMERGIESRRAVAILFYVAQESTYLSSYIAGITDLNLNNNLDYERYNGQMRSYNAWVRKGSKFEMLELLLEFASVVRRVRRAHQFSGLILAIIKLLCAVQRRVMFCETGLEYIFNIFKEIVFARPLLSCYVSITELMESFANYIKFSQNLCISSDARTISLWKDALHFTPDTCVILIYIAQIEFYQPDPVTTIHLAHALICFLYNALVSNSIPWMTGPQGACQCGVKLLASTVKLLYKCARINVATSEQVEGENSVVVSTSYESHISASTSRQSNDNRDGTVKAHVSQASLNLAILDREFRIKLRNKQLVTVKKGVQFMCYLATRDADFIIRLMVIEDSFHLFMEHIQTFGDLNLNRTEQEALRSIKSEFTLNKTLTGEGPVQSRRSACKKLFTYKKKLPVCGKQYLLDILGKTFNPKERSYDWLKEVELRRK